jgi:hypothetical protein
LKIQLLVAVLLLASCGGEDAESRQQQETLDTLNAEMSLEERVAACNGYLYDPDFTYLRWQQRWEDVLDLEVPDRETFDRWIEQDVCIDSEFPGGQDA